jgi:hypothetical protein
VQFNAVNPLCLCLGVVNVTHKAEASAPDLRDLNLITRLNRPTFGHLIGGSGYPMSVDLIVLGNELTAIYFPLSHDTLSVVGSDGAGSRPSGGWPTLHRLLLPHHKYNYTRERINCQVYYLFYKE